MAPVFAQDLKEIVREKEYYIANIWKRIARCTLLYIPSPLGCETPQQNPLQHLRQFPELSSAWSHSFNTKLKCDMYDMCHALWLYHVRHAYDMMCTQHVWDDIYVACMMWCVTCDILHVWHVTCVLHLWHMMGHACDICDMWLTCDTTYMTQDDMTCMRWDMQHDACDMHNMKLVWQHEMQWCNTREMVTCNMLRHDNMHDMKCNMQHETWWHATRDTAPKTWLTCMWCAMWHDLCDIRCDVCQKHVACYSYVTHITLDVSLVTSICV